MQIQNQFLQQRTLLPSATINRSIQRRIGADPSTQRGHRVDNVRLSPQARMTSMLEALTKQKESINKQKNDLIARTIDNGGNLDNIKEQLAFYEEQLKNIDAQISDVYEQQAKSIAEEQKEKNNTYPKNNQPKTKEEAAMQQLHTLTAIDRETANAEKIHAIQKGKESEARISQSEIKSSEYFISDLQVKGSDGITKVDDLITREQQTISEKETLVQQLHSDAQTLSDTAAKHIQQAQEKLAENQEITENTNKEEEEEKQESEN